MKHKLKIIGTILSIALVLTTKAQNIPDPEFSGRPYYLSENELKALERTDATVDVKSKGMVYGGVEVFYSVFGKISPIRFKKSELPKLIVKIDGSADPAESIMLAKTFEQKKDRRRFIKSKLTGVISSKSKDISKYDVALDFKKIRDGLYEVIITGQIEPGEYAFMPIASDNSGATKIKLTCFGIDE